MKNQSSVFHEALKIDFAKNELIHRNKKLPFIRLPERIDDSLKLISELTQKFINLNEIVFFSEHWSLGRTLNPDSLSLRSAETYFSVPFFIEETQKILTTTSPQFSSENNHPLKLNIAFAFNLFESGAALEDHDHFQTLSEIYEKKGLFNAFIFRPLHAFTKYHLFSLKDYELLELPQITQKALILEKELLEMENDLNFPAHLSKWTQTYSRRKREILSIEHFENLFSKRILMDLQPSKETYPEYFAKWIQYAEQIRIIYESEAALRNQNLKEKLFNFYPNLHDSPSFLSISVRIASAFFKEASFIFQSDHELKEFEHIQNSLIKIPPLDQKIASQCLEIASEYLQEYEDHLIQTRTTIF